MRTEAHHLELHTLILEPPDDVLLEGRIGRAVAKLLTHQPRELIVQYKHAPIKILEEHASVREAGVS